MNLILKEDGVYSHEIRERKICSHKKLANVLQGEDPNLSMIKVPFMSNIRSYAENFKATSTVYFNDEAICVCSFLDTLYIRTSVQPNRNGTLIPNFYQEPEQEIVEIPVHYDASPSNVITKLLLISEYKRYINETTTPVLIHANLFETIDILDSETNELLTRKIHRATVSNVYDNGNICLGNLLPEEDDHDEESFYDEAQKFVDFSWVKTIGRILDPNSFNSDLAPPVLNSISYIPAEPRIKKVLLKPHTDMPNLSLQNKTQQLISQCFDS
tara:strand:- start:1827 stop:2639 length:813 start_codon:yes stop_codon:yes gene_type:complete